MAAYISSLHFPQIFPKKIHPLFSQLLAGHRSLDKCGCYFDFDIQIIIYYVITWNELQKAAQLKLHLIIVFKDKLSIK